MALIKFKVVYCRIGQTMGQGTTTLLASSLADAEKKFLSTHKGYEIILIEEA